ncbi:MAG: hypothetical protein ACRYF5_14980, partial [Janthinobacterium lividum]
ILILLMIEKRHGCCNTHSLMIYTSMHITLEPKDIPRAGWQFKHFFTNIFAFQHDDCRFIEQLFAKNHLFTVKNLLALHARQICCSCLGVFTLLAWHCFWAA